MKEKEFDFNELIESMKQGAAILRGEMNPSRVFVYPAVDVKAYAQNPGGLCPHDRCKRRYHPPLGVGQEEPDGAAVSLLKIVSTNPEYVESILQA